MRWPVVVFLFGSCFCAGWIAGLLPIHFYIRILLMFISGATMGIVASYLEEYLKKTDEELETLVRGEKK